MVRDKTLLVGVDDSDSSLRSVSYVANLLEGRGDFHIVLFHVLPATPPELLEFGGAEDPGLEQKLDAKLKRQQAEWLEKAKQEAEPIMEQARTLLHQAGIGPSMISEIVAPSIHRPDIVRDLIETAHSRQCGTIVVGWESYSSFKEMFHQHVGEKLVGQSEGLAVWVVT